MNPPTPARIHATLVLLLALAGLDQTILSTALPVIAAELHGQSQVSWVFSAYLVPATVVVPLYGKLADRYGPRPLLLAAAGLFALGSAACAASPGIDALIAARALQGLGGGGLMTLTLLAVAALFTPEERARRQGLLGGAYGLATMVGPLVGSVLVQHLTWRWTLVINLPLVLLALAVLARARFGAPAARRLPLDWRGAALLAVALVALLLSTRAGLAGTAAGWGLLAGAGALAWAWSTVQRRAVDPLVPFALFRSAAFRAAAVISLCSGVSLFASVVFLPLILQAGLRLSPVSSALHLMPQMLLLTLAANGCGRLLRRGVPVRKLAGVGCGALVLAFGALATLLAAAPGRAWAYSLAVMPLGLGLGLLFPVLTVVSQRSAAPRYIGVATSTPIMLRALGGAVGVSLLGTVLAHGMPAALLAHRGDRVLALADPLQQVFLLAAVVAALAWAASRRLPTRVPSAPGVPATGRPGTTSAEDVSLAR